MGPIICGVHRIEYVSSIGESVGVEISFERTYNSLETANSSLWLDRGRKIWISVSYFHLGQNKIQLT